MARILTWHVHGRYLVLPGLLRITVEDVQAELQKLDAKAAS